MGVTVQVRDLDSEVQERLRRAAEREGLSLSAFLRRELTRLAEDLRVRERAEQLRPKHPLGGPIPGFANIDIQEVVADIRDDRDNR